MSTVSPTTTRPSAMPLLVAIASLLGLGATYLVAVHTHLGQLADTRAMLALAQVLAGVGWTEAVLVLVSPVTAVMATLSLAAIAAALRGGRVAAAVLVTAGGTAVGATVLKALLVRPQLVDDAANSLPSGHVAAVAGVAAAAALVATPPTRLLVVATGAAAVGLTGLATIALEWHRPSDVVASALLAVGVAGLVQTRAAFSAPRCPRPSTAFV